MPEPGEYTPTTEEVRSAWSAWWEPREDREPPTWNPSEFDRWLAQVKAEAVAAERERCARIAERAAVYGQPLERVGARMAAAAIRADNREENDDNA